MRPVRRSVLAIVASSVVILLIAIAVAPRFSGPVEPLDESVAAPLPRIEDAPIGATGAPPRVAPPPARDALAPDVRVNVDAWQGPHGGAPVQFDRRLYGMNIADWSTKDYRPEPNETFLAYLEALSPGILRYPAGRSSQERVWEGDPIAYRAERSLTKGEVDDFIQLARAAKAEPVLAVNTRTGTPAGAADLVRYVNVEKGYGVRWFQIGNEPDDPNGGERHPRSYASDLLRFEREMRRIDPSIQLVGGELMTGAHIIASNGAADWITPILRTAGEVIDAVSWHYYPLDSDAEEGSAAAATVTHLLQEDASDWRPAGLNFIDQVFPALERARGTYATGVEVWVTEYGEDPSNGGAEGISDTHAGALWAAETLGRFAAHGTDAMAKFVFKSGSDHRFTLLDEENRPRPSYYTYWMYAHAFGNRMVNATSDDKSAVNAHAALREDGALSVVLINKENEPRVAELSFEGFSPTSAGRYLIEGDSYDARNVTLNGQTLMPGNLRGPGVVSPQAVEWGPEPAIELPPLSVTLLVLRA